MSYLFTRSFDRTRSEGSNNKWDKVIVTVRGSGVNGRRGRRRKGLRLWEYESYFQPKRFVDRHPVPAGHKRGLPFETTTTLDVLIS